MLATLSCISKIGPVLFYLSEKTVHESELEERLSRLVFLDDDLAKRLIKCAWREPSRKRLLPTLQIQ